MAATRGPVPPGAFHPGLSDAELVELSGAIARSVPGDIGWYPSEEGYKAQAELTRRLAMRIAEATAATAGVTAAIGEFSSTSAAASKTLERYTRVLIILTVVLAVLGIVGVIVAATN